MRLAILFWFYKDIPVCENRLKLLRKYNPDVPIYGLYGGSIADGNLYSSALSKYLDDFYVFDHQKDAYWKWLNGDLMITEWFSARGVNLPWDTIVVVQWDMLVLGSLRQIFAMLKEDELLISGLRPVEEVPQWYWVSEDEPQRREMYLEFLEYVQDKYNFRESPLCSLFVVACLPRKFLMQYSEIENKELGFFEYRIPIYAQIFKTPICMEHPFRIWWDGVEPFRRSSTLNAAGGAIPLLLIYLNLLFPVGARVFHPYHNVFPIGYREFFHILASKIQGTFKKMRVSLNDHLLRSVREHGRTP